MASDLELFAVRGVPVRLHKSFVFLAIILVLLAVAWEDDPQAMGQRIAVPLVLFVVVLLHELGHTLAALRVGVSVVDIRLTPLGGVARISGTIEDGRKEAMIAAAGPLTNLALAGIGAGVMIMLGQPIPQFGELLLLDGGRVGLTSGLLVTFLALNVALGVVNLIPAFPLDGGRILRGLLSLSIGRLPASRIACRLGTWFGLMLIVAPFFLDGRHWWGLPFIGGFVIFGSLRERLIAETHGNTRGAAALWQDVLRKAAEQQAGRRGRQPDARTETTDAAPNDPDIIDVSGRSRIVDDDDA